MSRASSSSPWRLSCQTSWGRKVDLNTPGFLSRYLRDDILAEAEPLYVEA
jgi:predicted nucleotidyltransferase